jgi:osmotically-inducible protein OsmY
MTTNRKEMPGNMLNVSSVSRCKPARYALLLLIACGAYATAGTTGPGGSVITPPPAAAPAISDRDITHAVKTKFGVRPTLFSQSFTIATSKGIVQLSGTTDHILASDRAEEIALAVKGVRGVVNGIQVKASGRTDAEIQRDVEKAILTNPATDAYEVQAKVNGGTVSLTGKVDSWAESQIAATVVKKIKGVRQVDNRIAVLYRTDRTDGQIASDIAQKLRYDARVNDALIKSRVKDGAVTLLGTVGSALERIRAHHSAWVAGVKSVNTDALKVDPGADPGALRKGKFMRKTDAQVKAAVQDALRSDPRVNAFNVTATVNRGAVMLDRHRRQPESQVGGGRNAKNVVGVWQVTNNIMARAENPATTALDANVDWALNADPVVNQYQVKTTVTNGRVTLRGTVNTYYEKMHAGNVVADLTGVMEVVNHLKVNDTGSYLFWTDTDPAATVPPRESDAAIKKDIQRHIWWSPFVDHKAVTVQVRNGKATLNGSVDSPLEENAAIENAYEGGAVAVVSNLKIRED